MSFVFVVVVVAGLSQRQSQCGSDVAKGGGQQQRQQHQRNTELRTSSKWNRLRQLRGRPSRPECYSDQIAAARATTGQRWCCGGLSQLDTVTSARNDACSRRKELSNAVAKLNATPGRSDGRGLRWVRVLRRLNEAQPGGVDADGSSWV
ncbi:hypothetical protein J1614_003351 [Plenodomus biglobosus]|nr:hypothetical protein J1614_003351 [Plenodomus biglobosus]